MAFKNVPKTKKSELAQKIATCRDVCLVFPETTRIPIWFWNKSDFYFVRVKINAGTRASFYVLDLQEDPPIVGKKPKIE